ncbi:hypothetical protein EDB84DRAFT_1441313 [Lactarius hengduanensis]|nr:hypothetical protein EDB84DRAFT_1441313 [Lactarius hengduanensis]
MCTDGASRAGDFVITGLLVDVVTSIGGLSWMARSGPEWGSDPNRTGPHPRSGPGSGPGSPASGGFGDADVDVESVAADRRWMWMIGEAACKGSPASGASRTRIPQVDVGDWRGGMQGVAGFGGFTDADVNVESVAADRRWMWMIGEAACKGVVMALLLLRGCRAWYCCRCLVNACCGEDARNRRDWTYDFLRDFITRLSWGGVVGKYRPGTEFKVQASKDDTTSRSVDEEHVGGPTESDSRRPTRHRIPTAKAKETLAGDGARASKTKRRAVALTSETEDNQIQPPKKEKTQKRSGLVKRTLKMSASSRIPSKHLKGRVFARAAEDSQNGCGNKSSNSDGLRNSVDWGE